MNLVMHPALIRLARRLLGRSYWPLRELYGYYRRNKADWRDPRWAASVERLRAYRQRHSGERCFILGNGPSLKDTDLSLLRNEVTFGMNRIYLLFDELGFNTTYYVAINKLVVEQCAPDIVRLPGPKFISWRARGCLAFTPDMMFVDDRANLSFQTDVTRPVWQGATVTYVALQLAYYMGFQQVILIGVDHSFETKGKPHTEVVLQGDDPNHFAPHYFGKGFRWQLPDLETSELAYRMAKWQFELKQREVIDATIGGKLQVFPKVDYYDLFRS